MENINSSLDIEKMNKIFVDKYMDYIELMRVAGCNEMDTVTKGNVFLKYKKMSDEEKATVVKDDLAFLDFFTEGGLVLSDEDGTKLYEGINKEIAHSVICTMSSMKDSVIFPKEYEEELEGPVTLPSVKDMVSSDMSLVVPNIKRMFLLGDSEKFHKRMTKLFGDSSVIERFSDVVDASVMHNDQSVMREYKSLMDEAIARTREIGFKENLKF